MAVVPRRELSIEQFTLTTRDGLQAQANRYRSRTSTKQGTLGITLVFAHGLSFHKEHWEPLISELFRTDLESSYPVIREAWAVEFPNHGQSAILNADELRRRSHFISCRAYGDIFSILTCSGLIDHKDEIIFVGHSAGATAGVLSTLNHTSHEIPYSSMILIEPMMYSQCLLANSDVRKWIAGITKACISRRDTWPSFAAAKLWLMERTPWRLWDPRVLDIYVHSGGLSQLPTSQYPDVLTGVTLTLPKSAQGASFGDVQTQHDGYEQLKKIPRLGVPVHAIFGSRPDYIPGIVRDNISALLREYPCGSVSYLQGASHEMVQECPKRLARALLARIAQDRAQLMQSRL